MTNPIIKLVHGKNSLNLIDEGKYWVSTDFIPPATQTSPLLASGTAQSRFASSQLVSQKANDSTLDFTVRCYGTSSGETMARARKLQSFLSHAGDKVTPLELHYRENSDIAAEPLWGEYGSNKRYTIIHANTQLTPTYPLANVRKSVVEVIVSCVIAPYATGQKMRLATASGGIIEDTLGTVDDRSRGLIIPEATTNKMTNPVFGHSTYTNGWTVEANLTTSQNTDNEYLHPGTINSVKITSRGTSSNIIYQSINAGNTNDHTLSVYVKLPDGGIPTTSICRLWYSTGKTTGVEYTDMGNGIYCLSWAGAGIASATATGLQVLNGYTVYVLGVQFEEKGYRTPLAWGDLLGCAWTGTAHASTSTRTVSRVRVSSDYLPVSEWSVMATIKVIFDAADMPTMTLFDADTSRIRVYYQNSDQKFYLSDSTNTVSSAAQTFSADDYITIGAVGEPGRLELYVNGSSAASGGTYTPPTAGSYLYIGTNPTPSLHMPATIVDFRTYSTAVSDTEVLADYTNIAAIIADGERVGRIPWLYASANSANTDNYVVCGGVPGSVDAKTDYKLSTGLGSDTVVFLSRLTTVNFIKWSNFHIEGPGTAVSIGTTTAELESGTIPAKAYRELQGLDCMLFGRVKTDASGLALQTELSNVDMTNELRNQTALSLYRYLYTNGMTLPGDSFVDAIESDSLTFALNAKQSSTANAYCDYFQIVPQPIMWFNSRGIAWLEESKPVYSQGADVNDMKVASLNGTYINLLPGKYNMLVSFENVTGISDTPVVTSVNVDYIDITPRYGLL